MKKRNPLMAYIEARQGDPAWLLELLRDAGFDELADDIETGEIKIPIGKDEDYLLLCAATEFRRLGLSPTYQEAADFAVKRGIGADEFFNFMTQQGGPYRRLRKYLPEDLFPGIHTKKCPDPK